MAIGIDDLLEAAAIAAAQEFGKQVAKGIYDALFGHLADRDDLRKAVEEIKSYVHQEFDELRNDTLYANTIAAIGKLKDFRNTGSNDAQFLHPANDAIHLAGGWVDVQVTKIGLDFLRIQYGPIIQYIVTDLAIWCEFAFNTNINATAALSQRIDNHLKLLALAKAQIIAMENVGATPLQSKAVTVRGRRDPDGRVPDTQNGYAWFETYKGPNFMQKFEETIPDATKEEAEKALRPKYNEVTAQLDADNARRNELVYKPLDTFCQSMKNLKGRLHSIQKG